VSAKFAGNTGYLLIAGSLLGRRNRIHRFDQFLMPAVDGIDHSAAVSTEPARLAPDLLDIAALDAS
jgi:hypothetical protein